MPCQQCGRPAVVQYQGGLTFCLDCNLKFQQSQDLILARLERQHNQLLDEIDMITGIPTVGGRYPERRQVSMKGTFNSIRIDRSNVGVVNTGSIQSVEVSLAGIRQGGEEELAAALKGLAEAIVNSTELRPDQKNEAVQMLDAIAAEAAKPEDARRKAVIRPVLSALGELVKVGASLATLWGKVGPIIAAAFA